MTPIELKHLNLASAIAAGIAAVLWFTSAVVRVKFDATPGPDGTVDGAIVDDEDNDILASQAAVTGGVHGPHRQLELQQRSKQPRFILHPANRQERKTHVPQFTPPLSRRRSRKRCAGHVRARRACVSGTGGRFSCQADPRHRYQFLRASALSCRRSQGGTHRQGDARVPGERRWQGSGLARREIERLFGPRRGCARPAQSVPLQGYARRQARTAMGKNPMGLDARLKRRPPNKSPRCRNSRYDHRSRQALFFQEVR
jgi:hypothetical protein